MKEPTQADMQVAHWTHRKCESIVNDVLTAFNASADKWGSLSLDERFGIALTLTMNICVVPWEDASTNKAKMRKELGRQFRLFIERGTEEVN